MVEQVSNCKLYHVTVNRPYKQMFVVDQIVSIGESYNPYFAFYEGAPLEYQIDDNGKPVKIKAVNWLHRVRGGTIKTSYEILSIIASDVASYYIKLCRELLMEEIRREEFDSEPPSRQRCLFTCATPDEARNWIPRIGGDGSICEVTCNGTIHRVDAGLLLADSEPLSITKERARAYWRGEVGENPQMETLFVGDAKVTGFGL